MGVVGFGSYRISSRSSQHRQALIAALSNGCKVIDTSSNYTNGESETLIGEVLNANSNFRPQIITKAGYIQGSFLAKMEETNSSATLSNEVITISEFHKHSISPDILRDQLLNSLERLQVKKIDTFLIHNPEYYFKKPNSNRHEFYQRIKKAFVFLEEAVSEGFISNYGVSSNNLILPPEHPEATSLSQLIAVARDVSSKHNFKTVQFPFNLIEVGALEKYGDYGNASLLDIAQSEGLKTIINRPLNAFKDHNLVRLATYDDEIKNLDDLKAQEHFLECLQILNKRWNQHCDEKKLAEEASFFEIPLITQFKEIWNKLPTPDSVEQVYFGHFFPFIARMWGESGLTAKESAPFYQLFEYSMLYSKKVMTDRANKFRQQAHSVGLVPSENSNPFAVDVIETYLTYGFDIVLVGMRKTEYVNQLKHLF